MFGEYKPKIYKETLTSQSGVFATREYVQEETIEVVSLYNGGIVERHGNPELTHSIVKRGDGSVAGDTRNGDQIEFVFGETMLVIGAIVSRIRR
jgi:hypothetical protein